MSKKSLGQFFTTNVNYILRGFEHYVRGRIILDPFAGAGDLLNWADTNGAKLISGLDIDWKLINSQIAYNDSLNKIPNAQFILTNPPYLAKNKMSAEYKSKLEMGKYEDLYLLAIKKIIEADPKEGIIIIPVNFLSAENSDHLRAEFLDKYLITKVNYFKQQVFQDTTYNVMAFHFTRRYASINKQQVVINFYPNNISQKFVLEKRFNYKVAGRELSKILNIKPLKTIRLTENYIVKHNGRCKIKAFFNDKKECKNYYVNAKLRSLIKNNIILLNCIDTNNSEIGWIKAEDIRIYNKDCLVGKNTSRNIAYVLLDCSVAKQEQIIVKFNEILRQLRKKYHSLFLTNFRDNDRKRISFDFCYKLITYCHNQIKDKSL